MSQAKFLTINHCHSYATGGTAEADEEAVEPAHAAVVQAPSSAEGLWAALKTVSWFQVIHLPASGTLLLLFTERPQVL